MACQYHHLLLMACQSHHLLLRHQHLLGRKSLDTRQPKGSKRNILAATKDPLYNFNFFVKNLNLL
jgi:hypothetical protein